MPLSGVRIPVLDLDDIEGITDILLRQAVPLDRIAGLATAGA
jgi:hypothetical protein